MATPLGWVVARITELSQNNKTYIERLGAYSYRRCETLGKANYVDAKGEEAWESKSKEELVTDIREELADAYAYTSALIFKHHNTQLVQILYLLAQANAILEDK